MYTQNSPESIFSNSVIQIWRKGISNYKNLLLMTLVFEYLILSRLGQHFLFIFFWGLQDIFQYL